MEIFPPGDLSLSHCLATSVCTGWQTTRLPSICMLYIHENLIFRGMTGEARGQERSMKQILDYKTHTATHLPYRQSIQTYHRANSSGFPIGHKTYKSGLGDSNLYFRLFLNQLVRFEPVEAQLCIVRHCGTSHTSKGMMFTMYTILVIAC